MLSAMPTPRIMLNSVRQRPSALRTGYGSRSSQPTRVDCLAPIGASIASPWAPSSDVEAALRLDFRSDTITQPTPAMREAMRSAEVGDDVFGEDPSINALELESARLFEKEAGLFVASGTQGNLLALLSLTRPGDELIAEASSHIANSEVGGAARLGGLTLRALAGRHGKLSPEQVAATVRPENVHYARTTLLAIENTHNAGGGTILAPDDVEALTSLPMPGVDELMGLLEIARLGRPPALSATYRRGPRGVRAYASPAGK